MADLFDFSGLDAEAASFNNRDKYGNPIPAPNRAGTNSPGYLGGFVQSALSSIPELFGARPTSGAEQFREENPKGGLASELAGMLVPYGAMHRVAETVPALKSFVQKAGAISDNPFVSGAAKNVATYAPLETARVAGTQLQQPENTGDTAISAGVNLGIEAGLGGIGGALKAAGRIKPVAEEYRSSLTSLRGPDQMKIAELKRALGEGKLDEKSLARAQWEKSRFELGVKLEDVGDRIKAVGDLDLGDPSQINRLFSGTRQGSVRVAKLIQSTKDFKSADEAMAIAKRAGLDDKWENVSLPRFVGFTKDTDVIKKVEEDFTHRGAFTKVDDNTLMNKEKDGLFIMARKIQGEIGKAAPTDEWVIWKTDQPGKFVPDVQRYVDQKTASRAFMREPGLVKTNNPLLKEYDEAVGEVEATPMVNYLSGAAKGMIGKSWDEARKLLGLPEKEGESFLTARTKEFFNKYLAPEMHQNPNSPRAQWISGLAHKINDLFQDEADKILFGDFARATKGSVIARALSNPERTGTYLGRDSIAKAISPLTDAERGAMTHAATRLVELSDDLASVEQHIDGMLAGGDITPNMAKALKTLNEWDIYNTSKIRALQEQAGLNPFSPLAGHVMLSRTWEGDFRAIITNEAGDKLYVAGGKTPDAANSAARAIISEGEKQGLKGLKLIDAKKNLDLQDLELSNQIKYKSDEFRTLSKIKQSLDKEPLAPITLIKDRHGMEGYKTKYTEKEFLDKLSRHINERYKYQSKITRQMTLGDEINNLLNESPKTFEVVKSRLDQLDGTHGWFGQWQNTAIDKVLAPVLGRNSATKITNTLSNFQFHLAFGVGNLHFPATQLAAVFQNVAPEIAFIANASNSALQRDYYGSLLMLGSDRRPRGLMGYLDPVKITLKSLRDIAKPSREMEDLINRAINKGILDPKIRPEFVGDQATTKLSLRESFEKGGWASGIQSVSSFLPEKMERFTRLQAFTAGVNAAKDLLGHTNLDDIFAFASKFTSRTMYEYKTTARPLAFSTPLGRNFGLFKNWQAHYMGDMARYAGEFNQGNFAPLLWQTAGTLSVAGIVGLPAYGIADAFSKMATNQTLMQNFYSAYESDSTSSYGNLHDAVFWGLPSFLGLTLSGSTAAPGANPMRDAAALMSFPVWQRAMDASKVMGEAVDQWALNGKHPATDERIRQHLALVLAPKTLNRYLTETEGMVISQRTGNLVEKGMTDYEVALYHLGFMPKRLGIDYKIQSELWEDQNKMRAALTNLGRAWLEAQDSNDADAMMALTRQAMMKGIPIDSIVRSANSLRVKKETPEISRQFKKLKVAEYSDLGLTQGLY